MPGARGDRLRDRARARRERLELERAHRPVPEDGAGVRDQRARSARRVLGPMSSPIQPVGHLDAVEHAVLGVGAEAVADHQVAGQLAARRPALGAARARCARARRPRRRTASRRPRGPARARNGKHIAPPIMIASAISRKRSITADLVGHLRAAEDRHERARRVLEHPRQRPHLALQQAARRALGSRCATPSVRRARGARRRTRRRRRHRRVAPARAAAPGRCCVSPGSKRTFSSSSISPGAELVGQRAATSSPDDRRRELHRRAGQLAQPLGDRRQRQLRLALPSGRPRCETSTRRAPRARSSSIVGSAARIRVSSATASAVLGAAR